MCVLLHFSKKIMFLNCPCYCYNNPWKEDNSVIILIKKQYFDNSSCTSEIVVSPFQTKKKMKICLQHVMLIIDIINKLSYVCVLIINKQLIGIYLLIILIIIYFILINKSLYRPLCCILAHMNLY